ISRRYRCALVALALAFVPAVRAEDALSRPELDKRVVNVLRDTIDQGATIFNSGNQEGCYRLYQGSLMAISPLLDHRPAAQKMSAQRLQKAQATRSASDRAFLLRELIDEVRATLAKDMPAAAVAGKSLWDRLGGEPAVRAVVHDFVLAAAPDPKVNFTRGGQFA